MEHDGRSDTELMTLAKRGWAPAFAVLLYRHGGAVRAVAAKDQDPTGAVIGTFVTAMRQLRHRDADEPVRPWLLELAARQTHDPVDVGAAAPQPLGDDELDEIWAELDVRWPTGRVSRRLPAWVGWAALVAALVALGVLVPYVVLTADGAEEHESLELLRALPLEVEEPEREPAPELFEDEALGDLPTFEFPEVEQAPPAASSGPAETTPDPPPSSPPAPPPPAGDGGGETADDGGDASPTGDGPTDDGPTDDGPTDDGPTDDEPTDDGPTDDGPTDDGPTDDGPTDDEPTDGRGPTTS